MLRKYLITALIILMYIRDGLNGLLYRWILKYFNKSDQSFSRVGDN